MEIISTNPLTFFVGTTISFTLLIILFFVKSPQKYFKTKEGKRVLSGMLMAIGVSVLVAFLFTCKANALEYFKTGEIFVGIDSSYTVSAFCNDGPNSDKLSSNIGAEISLIRLESGLSEIRLKYNHHSCAVNPDRNTYDSLGLTVKYVLW